MKILSQWAGAALLLCFVASGLRAAELTSGLPVGSSVGAYTGTKAGGIDDGVDFGKSLCYT